MTPDDLPDDQRCDLPGCDREAAEPTTPGPNACPEHHPDRDADGRDERESETVVDALEGVDDSPPEREDTPAPGACDDPGDTGENRAPEGGFPDGTPTPDADTSASSTPDDGEREELGDTDASNGDDTHHVELDGDRVRDHYRQVRPVYEALGAVDGHPTTAPADYTGWYITRPQPDPDLITDGWDKQRRPVSLANDLREIYQDKLDRTLYALTSYKTRDAYRHWTPARRTEDGYEHKDTDNPNTRPEDLRAVAAWGDIDLADDLKGQRGDLDPDVLATAEAALDAYIDEFAELYGGRDAVYALDSVGGAYVFGAPEVTLPIAEYFRDDDDEEAIGEVLREFIDRSNDWLKAAQDRVESRVEGAAQVIDPDWANNHNRQYKAPLAIHQDHDAVTTPLDTDGVDYSVTRLEEVTDGLVERGVSWAQEFTRRDHDSDDRLNHIIGVLWPDYAADADGWRETLKTWLNDKREDERQKAGLRETSGPNTDDRDLDLTGLDITPYVGDVEDAIDSLDAHRVAEDTIVRSWTDHLSDAQDRSGDGKRACVPTWAGTYNSGNATYIDEKKGIFNDTDDGTHGTVVEMALIASESWPRGKIARGEDWARGVRELQQLGYDIPVWTPDAETAAGRAEMPYWALRRAAIALGVIDEDDLVERENGEGDTYLGFADADTYNGALDAVEAVGLSHGRDRVETGTDVPARFTAGVETCSPPPTTTQSFDRDERWAHLQGERYDDTLAHDGPVVWADPAGSGKTTNALLGGLNRDRPTAVLFDKHEKAREVATDDALPDDWDPYHLKGGEQKLHDTCLDADHNDHDCPDHGDTAQCPSMCPVYDLTSDDPLRQQYDAIARELGDVKAHLILGEELPGHDDEGHCAWSCQFEELESATHVVGVHEYQTLKTLRAAPSFGDCEVPVPVPTDERDDYGQCEAVANSTDERCQNDAVDESGRCTHHGGEIPTRPCQNSASGPSGRCFPHGGQGQLTERDLFVDESPRSLRSSSHVAVEALVRAENALGDLADALANDDPTKYTARRVASFVGDLLDAVTTADGDADLGQIDPPTPVWDTYESYDPAAGNYLERVEPDENWHIGEALTQLKVAYNETLLSRIRRGEWDGAPFCMDSVLAALAAAGLPTRPVMKAVAAPSILDECPWCRSPLEAENGARCCASDTCEWHEQHNTLTQPDGETARAQARLEDGGGAGLYCDSLPLESDLPTDPVVLDATATPSKIAHIYGVSRDDLAVYGDDHLEANMRVTQVLDGQYHASTIKDGDTARKRIQTSIDTAADLYQKPLFVCKKELKTLFDFPDHAEVLHYHAARGLNRNDCDAVFCLGAPHPDVEALRREAELLSMGRDTRVGGDEHSTRRDAENPPVYRKLRFSDGQGDGRAVPTKHYTGLVGDLFRETREKEIEQVAHRARPLLADDPVDVYLLTNVPTDLQIDEVCSFDELADPVSALLPVRDGAVELLKAVHGALEGEIDGFRPGQLVETHSDGTVANKVAGYHRLARQAGLNVTERTVRNYVDDLEAVGLLHPEEYEQHAGVSYAGDSATLQAALSVLTDNGGFKVAALRRLRTLVEADDGSLSWLTWAREALGLSGDRCEWDPPDVSPG